MDSSQRLNSCQKCGNICFQKITSGRFGFLLLSLFLLFFGLLDLLPTEIKATATYYEKNKMTSTGTLNFVGGQTYSPNDNLDDGSEHTIYLSSAAERAMEYNPQLTNMTETIVNGWIGDGYQVRISLGGNLEVYQDYTQNNNTRWAWYEYEFNVIDIDTEMLYRSERGNNYITLIVVGLILLTAWSLIKGVRND